MTLRGMTDIDKLDCQMRIGKVYIVNNIARKCVGQGLESLKYIIGVLAERMENPVDIDSVFQEYEGIFRYLDHTQTVDIGIMVDYDTFSAMDYELEGTEIRRYVINPHIPEIIEMPLIDAPKEPVPAYISKLYAYDKRRNYSKKNNWNRIRSRLF